MKKTSMLLCLLVSICFSLSGAEKYVIVNKNTGDEIPIVQGKDEKQPLFRASIQSTSVDWEAVSGLRFSEYKITFSGIKAAGGIGWEIYFLDAFPCYGSAQYTRTWVGAGAGDAFLRANCVTRPKEVQLAYRSAKKDERQGRTTGILSCSIDKKNVVNLEKCDKQDWSDFERE
jgi:hypothetical protein